MKQRMKLIIIIIIFIIFLNFINKRFSKGYDIKYKVNTIIVNEKYTKKSKSHYFKLKTKKGQFFLQFYDLKGKKIIKDIKYYKDKNYECILPIFDEKKVLTDIICKKEDYYYNYKDIENKNKKIDNFANKIKEYNKKNYTDKLIKKAKNKDVTLYNIIDKHYIVMDNYKGLYLINKDIINIKLFKKDIYTKDIKGLLKKYYLIADYNNDYDFHKFYVIDVTNGNKTEIISNNSISIDSYVQGVYRDNIYLYDRNNEKQYEINIINKTVIEVGNKEYKTKYYELNKLKNISIYELKDRDYLFNYYDVTNEFDSRYKKVYKNKDNYYFIKELNNKYDVYRSNKRSKTEKIYLFSLKKLPKIYFVNDYVYFIEEEYLKVYHDQFGVKTILKDNELKFNDNIKIEIYIK